jgi:hypothetical protein
MLEERGGVPVYHGFMVVPETLTDGWCLGVISGQEDPEGSTSGDAYVVAPDGSSAGLVWEVGDEPMVQILPPDSERWGIYAISFPHPVRNAEDLASAFRSVLPALKEAHARFGPQATS